MSAAGSTAPATTRSIALAPRARTSSRTGLPAWARRSHLGALGGVGEGGGAYQPPARPRRHRTCVVEGLLDGPNLLVPDEVELIGCEGGAHHRIGEEPQPRQPVGVGVQAEGGVASAVDTHRSSARRSWPRQGAGVAVACAVEEHLVGQGREPGLCVGVGGAAARLTTRTLWGQARLGHDPQPGAVGELQRVGAGDRERPRGHRRPLGEGVGSGRGHGGRLRSAGEQSRVSRSITHLPRGRSVLLRSRGGPEGGPVGPRGAAPPPP